MTYYHSDSPKPLRVKEPVQVYLGASDQELLERLTQQLGRNKSEVLREGLAALERELTDPEQHPILKLIGIAGNPADLPPLPDLGYNVAEEHDRFLADTEEETWDRPSERDER